MAGEIRLNKFISDTGFCSRREADQLIADDRVTVNGLPACMGMKVQVADKVRIDGEILKYHSVREELALIKVEKRKKQRKPSVDAKNEAFSAVPLRKRGAWKIGLRKGKSEQMLRTDRNKNKGKKS